MSISPNLYNELIELTLSYAKVEGICPTPLAQLQVARSDGKTQPVHTVYRPSLCFIIQGEKEAISSNKTYRYMPGQFLVASVDLLIAGRVTKASVKNPYLCLILDLDPNVIYEILKESDARFGRQTDEAAKKGIFVDEVEFELADAILRLARTLKDKNDMRVLAPAIIREVTYRLLNTKHAEVVRQLGIVGSQTQRIAKVIDLIKKEYARTLTTEELAKVANMSVSSFHQHFKQITEVSPLQYQKQMRLQEARRLLSAEISDAATVAFKVGYESPSQFSREYSRLFGQPPARDMKNLRRA